MGNAGADGTALSTSMVMKNKEVDNTKQSEGTTSYVTIRTVTFAADEVSGDVFIIFNLRGISDDGSAGVTIEPMAQITVDGVQDTEFTGPPAVREIWVDVTKLAQDKEGKTGVYVWQYTPTSGEKSSGFVVNLDLKVSSAVGDAYNDFWWVQYQ
jgi:hypothetical protein